MTAPTTDRPIHPRPNAPAGVYIHIPDRGVIPDRDLADYLQFVREEFGRRADDLAGREIASIYFAGEPPRVPMEWLSSFVRTVCDRLSVAEPEVTLEASPGRIDRRRLSGWERAGITRIIVAAESFDAEILEQLGAVHDVETAERALVRCRAYGRIEIGVDLAFAVPGQSLGQFAADLERLAELGVPESVFGYEHLPVEADESDEERSADMFEWLVDWAERFQLRRYEVAGFCRPGRESRHNTLYWTGGEYLGLGLGASSFVIDEGVPTRRRNAEEGDRYGIDGGATVSRLEPEAYFVERVTLALRSRAGLDWEVVVEQCDGAVAGPRLAAGRRALDWAAARSLGEWDGERFRPTDRGLDLADGLAREVRSRIEGD